MKKIAFILVFLSTTLAMSFAQTSTDTITVKKVGGGYRFYKADQLLTMTQLVDAVKSNDLAYTQIKSAQSSHVFSSILGGVGGFMVGWQLGATLGGGKANWGMAGVGAGLIVIAMPIAISSGKKAKEAVDTYNGGLSKTSFWDRHELKLNMRNNSIGLALNF